LDCEEEELKTSGVIADGGSLKSTTRAAIDYEHVTVTFRFISHLTSLLTYYFLY